MSLKCSAEWTLGYLLKNGYLKNWKAAVMSHNGTPWTKRTVAYLRKVEGYMVTFVPTL